ncbi:MAG: hypothetical protein PHN45_00135 [Methylococcales bacterium]|nr:hypothetical protein [Methylococcales bacterium]
MSSKTSKQLSLDGAFLIKIEYPQVNYFYSFGTSGFVVYGNEPVQIKWSCTPTKQEIRRTAHFLHTLDPNWSNVNKCISLRAAWYFIDAEHAKASIIHSPSHEDLKHLDLRIKRDLNNDHRRMLLTTEFFKALETKELNSYKRKRKILQSEGMIIPPSPKDGSIPPIPKRRRIMELRKIHNKSKTRTLDAMTMSSSRSLSSMFKNVKQQTIAKVQTQQTTVTETTASPTEDHDDFDEQDLLDSIERRVTMDVFDSDTSEKDGSLSDHSSISDDDNDDDYAYSPRGRRSSKHSSKKSSSSWYDENCDYDSGGIDLGDVGDNEDADDYTNE